MCGDGESGRSKAITAARFGMVWGLPKDGGKNRAPFWGSVWQGVLGGEGETGALRLLLLGSMWVGDFVLAEGAISWVFM